MSKISTGSAYLKRKHFFNNDEEDIDIPDGDVMLGQRIYKDQCIGCHQLDKNTMAPKLHNVFGKTAGTQKGFMNYSIRNRTIGYRWSKQKLYRLLENPQEILGLDSGMLSSGLTDIYERVSLIQYLHYMRITTSSLVKPQWVN